MLHSDAIRRIWSHHLGELVNVEICLSLKTLNKPIQYNMKLVASCIYFLSLPTFAF